VAESEPRSFKAPAPPKIIIKGIIPKPAFKKGLYFDYAVSNKIIVKNPVTLLLTWKTTVHLIRKKYI
jgi:hypothetical protein